MLASTLSVNGQHMVSLVAATGNATAQEAPSMWLSRQHRFDTKRCRLSITVLKANNIPKEYVERLACGPRVTSIKHPRNTIARPLITDTTEYVAYVRALACLLSPLRQGKCQHQRLWCVGTQIPSLSS